MATPTGDAGIYARESTYLDRYVQFGEAGDRIISVSFPTQPDADSSEGHPLLDRPFLTVRYLVDRFEDLPLVGRDGQPDGHVGARRLHVGELFTHYPRVGS